MSAMLYWQQVIYQLSCSYCFLVEAVPKIVAIKQKREAAFIRKRLMKGIENRKAEDIKLVNTQMHLIKAPNGNY